MSNPSAFEQLMLEYINRARMDPQGEFDRFIVSTSPVQAIEPGITSALNYFNVDLALYQQQLAGLQSVAPLAWSSTLNDAATAHSQLMVAQDAQSHQLPGEAGLSSRVSAAGYDNWNFLAENVYAYTQSAAFGHAGFFVDWGGGVGGMQNPAGHRINIMRENVTEVGIGVVEDWSGATSVGPYVVTQDFGSRSDYQPQFVGACYDDNDGDDFYSIGEGAGGISVAVAGAVGTITENAGGYALVAPPGVNTLTFSGGNLPAAVSVDIVFGAHNVKVDLVDGDTVQSSADAALGAGALDLILIGRFSIDGTGNAADNVVQGNSEANLLIGRLGTDTLFGGDGDDTLKGNVGLDELHGGAGNDAAYGGVGADRIFADAGNDLVRGHKGSDVLHGGTGRDVMYGDRHSDTLFGEGGDDVLRGGLHNDRLFGGAGRDNIAGHGGWDTLHGGAGDDTLFGGVGDDTFVFEPGFGADVITDFRAGADDIDVLDFSALGIAMDDLDVANQAGATLITTPGGDSVLLTGVLPDELDSLHDFLF